MKTFVRIDAWEEISRTDHYRYVKKLVDGKVLRTRISFGRGAAFDDPALWAHVWRRQLDLRSEDEFWAALRTGQAGRPHVRPIVAGSDRADQAALAGRVPHQRRGAGARRRARHDRARSDGRLPQVRLAPAGVDVTC